MFIHEVCFDRLFWCVARLTFVKIRMGMDATYSLDLIQHCLVSAERNIVLLDSYLCDMLTAFADHCDLVRFDAVVSLIQSQIILSRTTALQYSKKSVLETRRDIDTPIGTISDNIFILYQAEPNSQPAQNTQVNDSFTLKLVDRLHQLAHNLHQQQKTYLISVLDAPINTLNVPSSAIHPGTVSS